MTFTICMNGKNKIKKFFCDFVTEGFFYLRYYTDIEMTGALPGKKKQKIHMEVSCAGNKENQEKSKHPTE